MIDYYSRYLLGLHFTHSYSAMEVSQALRLAMTEAERLHGPLRHPVFLVTDNGPSFIAQRFRDTLNGLRIAGTGVSVFSQVRIGYRMPSQLGLLERFHGTLKQEEVYWNSYDDPREARSRRAGRVVPGALQPGAAALGVGRRRSDDGAGPSAHAPRGLCATAQSQPTDMVPVGGLAGKGPGIPARRDSTPK